MCVWRCRGHGLYQRPQSFCSMQGWDRGKPAVFDVRHARCMTSCTTHPMSSSMKHVEQQVHAAALSSWGTQAPLYILMDPSVRIKCGLAFPWQWRPSGTGVKRLKMSSQDCTLSLVCPFHFGRHLWQAKHRTGQVYCQSHPDQGHAPCFIDYLYCTSVLLVHFNNVLIIIHIQKVHACAHSAWIMCACF